MSFNGGKNSERKTRRGGSREWLKQKYCNNKDVDLLPPPFPEYSLKDTLRWLSTQSWPKEGNKTIILEEAPLDFCIELESRTLKEKLKGKLETALAEGTKKIADRFSITSLQTGLDSDNQFSFGKTSFSIKDKLDKPPGKQFLQVLLGKWKPYCTAFPEQSLQKESHSYLISVYEENKAALLNLDLEGNLPSLRDSNNSLRKRKPEAPSTSLYVDRIFTQDSKNEHPVVQELTMQTQCQAIESKKIRRLKLKNATINFSNKHFLNFTSSQSSCTKLKSPKHLEEDLKGQIKNGGPLGYFPLINESFGGAERNENFRKEKTKITRADDGFYDKTDFSDFKYDKKNPRSLGVNASGSSGEKSTGRDQGKKEKEGFYLNNEFRLENNFDEFKEGMLLSMLENFINNSDKK